MSKLPNCAPCSLSSAIACRLKPIITQIFRHDSSVHNYLIYNLPHWGFSGSPFIKSMMWDWLMSLFKRSSSFSFLPLAGALVAGLMSGLMTGMVEAATSFALAFCLSIKNNQYWCLKEELWPYLHYFWPSGTAWRHWHHLDDQSPCHPRRRGRLALQKSCEEQIS